MARKAKSKIIEEPITSGQVSLALVYGGKTETCEGRNILDCIEKLFAERRIYKDMGVVRATSGNLTAELAFNPMQLRRLNVNKILREIKAKQLALALH